MSLLALASACGTDIRPSPDASSAAAAASLAAIRSDIFEGSCGFGSCHAGTTPAAHLDLRNGDVCHALVGRTSCLFPTKLLVVPGKPELSFLVDKLAGRSLAAAPASDCADSNEQMPFGAPPLPAEKLAQIEDWIRAGAPCESTGGSTTTPPDAGVGTPADIAALDTASPEIRAGEHTHVTVTLAHPAPAGGQLIDLDVADASVLGVPSAVHVAGGASTIDVDVIGKRPARPVAVTASSGASAVSVAIGVSGLELSEIEFDPPSTDDGYEWIKLANTSYVAIDLSAYSLGSGRASYTYSLAQLSGTIPARSCFVIGGPISTSGNGSPVYAQTFNFSPDLVNGSGTNGQAAGFALFDVPITRVDPSTIPLDAVLCGQTNSAGMLDASGTAATPSCPDVVSGHSVSRTSSTAWTDQPVPTPNLCSMQ